MRGYPGGEKMRWKERRLRRSGSVEASENRLKESAGCAKADYDFVLSQGRIARGIAISLISFLGGGVL